MTQITDDYMREMSQKTRPYTIVILRKLPKEMSLTRIKLSGNTDEETMNSEEMES